MGVLGVLLALSTIFIWGRLVNIDYDLKDISEELKKMNESFLYNLNRSRD